MPGEPQTFYFLANSGKIYQINNVVLITFASPLLANGTYRDDPPVIPGGGAVALAETTLGSTINAQLGGGMEPVVATSSGGVEYVYVTGKSSVLQSDSFAHVAPRNLFEPMSMVFFETSWGGASNPIGTTFPIAAPATNFAVFDVDCAFPWTKNCGIFNAAPQGWIQKQTS